MDFRRPLAAQMPQNLSHSRDAHESAFDFLVQIALVDGTHPHRRGLVLYADSVEVVVPPSGDVVRTDGDATGIARMLVQGAGWLAVLEGNAGRGRLSAEVVAETGELAEALVDHFRPWLEAPGGADGTVPLTFWHLDARRGAARDIAHTPCPTWVEIEANYAGRTRAAVERVVQAGPARDGRIILFHGSPGTGKTTAIRAMAREWKDDCSVEVVIDPERLFGDPGYLTELLGARPIVSLLAESRGGTPPAHSMIVIEDADELITRDAKKRTGQDLSRMLNLADGLLGQKRRPLICITTNEPVDELHPAIRRPGRCLADIAFEPLSPAESAVWLEGTDAPRPRHPVTLAELLVLRGDLDDPLHAAGAPLEPTGVYL